MSLERRERAGARTLIAHRDAVLISIRRILMSGRSPGSRVSAMRSAISPSHVPIVAIEHSGWKRISGYRLDSTTVAGAAPEWIQRLDLNRLHVRRNCVLSSSGSPDGAARYGEAPGSVKDGRALLLWTAPPVTPATAGVHADGWTPAFAGVTRGRRGSDEQVRSPRSAVHTHSAPHARTVRSSSRAGCRCC